MAGHALISAAALNSLVCRARSARRWATRSCSMAPDRAPHPATKGTNFVDKLQDDEVVEARGVLNVPVMRHADRLAPVAGIFDRRARGRLVHEVATPLPSKDGERVRAQELELVCRPVCTGAHATQPGLAGLEYTERVHDFLLELGRPGCGGFDRFIPPWLASPLSSR